MWILQKTALSWARANKKMKEFNSFIFLAGCNDCSTKLQERDRRRLSSAAHGDVPPELSSTEAVPKTRPQQQPVPAYHSQQQQEDNNNQQQQEDNNSQQQQEDNNSQQQQEDNNNQQQQQVQQQHQQHQQHQHQEEEHPQREEVPLGRHHMALRSRQERGPAGIDLYVQPRSSTLYLRYE